MVRPVVYLCELALQVATQFGPVTNQKVKLIRNFANKKLMKTCHQNFFIHVNFVERDNWLRLTSYLDLIINYIRFFSRTTATFKIISIIICHLTLEAIKHVWIKFGHLRIKTSNWFATLRFNFMEHKHWPGLDSHLFQPPCSQCLGLEFKHL